MEKIFLTKQEIEQKIKNYCDNLYDNNLKKTTLFIGILNGSLVFSVDILRTYESILSELDFIFKIGKKSFTNLKSENLKNKNVVLLVDRITKNSDIQDYVDYILKKKPDNISVFAILKDNNYVKTFNYNFDFLCEVEPNDIFYGYGINSVKELTDYNNLYIQS